MNPFGVHVPTEVCFGEGRVEHELAAVISRFNPARVLLVTDPGLVKAGVIQPIIERLTLNNLKVELFRDVEPDPSVETVHLAANVFQDSCADLFLAVGGGSSIDTAKGARVIVTQGGHIRNYSGLNAKPVNDTSRIPLVVIPTTAGTGSEVTFFGVYSDWENNLKVTVTSPYMAPTVALVDSSLTCSLPSHITASSGIDVLAHAIETYVSRIENPFSEALALRAMELVGSFLKTAVFYGANRVARNGMSEASLLAGIAFNHTFLGLTHAIAAAVSGHAHVPHGVAIGLLLPHVMRFNLQANEDKFSRIAQLLSAGKSESAEDAPEIVQKLAKDIGIPQQLSNVGVTQDMFPGIAKQTLQSVQLRFNPRPATEREILELLSQLY